MSEEFPSAEHKDCREQFRPVARKYRRHGGIVVTFILLGMLSAWAASKYHYDRSPWFVAFFLLCCVGGVVAMLRAPTLRCPGCGADAGGVPERFCPDCGDKSVVDNALSAYRCTSCRKRLTSRRGGRRYRVRFCTHCGAHLDDAGV